MRISIINVVIVLNYLITDLFYTKITINPKPTIERVRKIVIYMVSK